MNLPTTGFIRLNQILGNPKTDPPIPAIIPVSKPTFWQSAKDRRYPQPVKLGKRCTTWSVDDIRRHIESVGGEK
jgi:prophage regulatory protein